MKKKYLIAVFVAFAAGSFAQDTVRLQFDAVQKELKSDRRDLPKGDHIIFVLNGVNTAIHKVTICPTARTLKSAVPDAIKGIVPFADNALELSKIVKLNYYSDEFLPDSVLKVSAANPRLSKDKTLESIMNHFFTLAGTVTGMEKEYESAIERINQNPFDVAAAQRAFDGVITKLDSVGYGKVGQSDQKKNIVSILKYTLAELNATTKLAEDYIDKHPKLYGDGVSYFNLIRMRRENDVIRDLRESVSAIATVIADALHAQGSVRSELYENTKDLTELKVVILNRYSGDTLLNATASMYTSGGWKLDFSTGTFYNTLYSDKYYLRTVDGSTTIMKESKEMFDIAVGALVHYTYRCTSGCKIGPSLGAAISPMDGKTRYLAGLSIIGGRKNQVCLTAGWTIGQRTMLSNAVSADNVTPNATLPAGLDAVPTIDRYKTGVFVGLTFNLTSKKE